MYRADADAINAQTQKASHQLHEVSNYLNAARSPLAAHDATVLVVLEGIVKTLHEMDTTLNLVAALIDRDAKG